MTGSSSFRRPSPVLAHLCEAISLERNVAVSVTYGDGAFGEANIPEPRLPVEARMVLTASQYSQIAATYEHAAMDLTLPPQSRAAFAGKAKQFRMLAMAVSQNSSPRLEPQRYRPLVGTDTPSSLPELELAKYNACLVMEPQRLVA